MSLRGRADNASAYAAHSLLGCEEWNHLSRNPVKSFKMSKKRFDTEKNFENDLTFY